MDKALIFDIQGFSVHDGPGARTLIFFAGCPLDCTWCSNPEGRELRQKIMFASKKCKRSKYECTRCLDACEKGAVRVNPEFDPAVGPDEETGLLAVPPLLFDWDVCNACTDFSCAKVCYAESIKLSGTWMTQDEVRETILRDRKYWSDGGGVTFSGGEAFMQHEFVRELAQWCQANKIHTGIETTAFVNRDIFLETMQHIDFAFIDVKHMDSDKHLAKTGVRNELILSNISALAKSDWAGRLILRMPVIRDFNDDDANIEATADFMESLGLFEINILPFHRLGDSKYNQLGLTYEYHDEQPTPEDKLEHIQDIFLSRKIACYVAEGVMY